MKKLVLLLFLTTNTINSQIAQDKKLHYAAGIISGAVGYDFVYKKTNNKKLAFAGSVFTSMLAGVVKETLDSKEPGNYFDKKDLVATTLGGITVGLTIELFNKKSKKRKKWDNYYY